MSELIVLGLIPGTHVQITFLLWIIAVSIALFAMLAWAMHRMHIFRDWIITVAFLLLTRRQIPA
ncbi:MAG TPA: hypothetical protein VIR03_02720 [Candidatus Saccharimonadales bacterium]